jgi:MoaA/NifB/PqqE/SkfB family radical SAM enzyme
MTGGLHPDLLSRAIADASAEGYNLAGFSGGEPLMYEPLPAMLDKAHECGMLTTVTTNGMLLDKRRVAALQGRADLVAISLDGTPESHNEMRESAHAFQKMRSRLDNLRSADMRFGFIFTLTQFNLDELEWVAQFALENGASLLQIHPLEEVGRAGEELTDFSPDSLECAVAFTEVVRIQAMAGERLHVHLDLADKEVLAAQPERVYADELTAASPGTKLADLVSPLVLQADGTLVPLQYGVDSRYSLGNLHSDSLQHLATRWRESGLREFRELCRAVYDDLAQEEDGPLINWYDAVSRKSRNRSHIISAAIA